MLILSATLRVATPLILCALGALFCERAGLIDIGLEGKMLAAAFIVGRCRRGDRLGWSPGCSPAS